VSEICCSAVFVLHVVLVAAREDSVTARLVKISKLWEREEVTTDLEGFTTLLVSAGFEEVGGFDEHALCVVSKGS